MKKVFLEDFSNNEQIYGGENSFQITCENGFNRTLSATISDAYNTNSADYLVSKGTASGFGVRLYDDNNKLLKFSPNSTEENTVTLKVENDASTIPLKAYYFKKDTSASVGTVNSLARITLEYS